MEFRLNDTRRKEVFDFNAREKGKVNMYVCGPTVYAPPHVGHGRSFVFFDTLARLIRFSGYELQYIQNITDMGKGINNLAKKLECSKEEVVDDFERKYFNAMEALNVDSVDVYERSSENIDQIHEQIVRMLGNGHAYHVERGVFFDTSMHRGFGDISGKAKGELAETEIYPGKRNVQDFSLWKADPNWGIELDSVYGVGRPHWHVLDTALAEKYFGSCEYDIHGAGFDCIYPHHESLRSILWSLSGVEEPVGFWIHNGLVGANGGKMSKSLGNTVDLEEVFKKHDPRAFRLWVLSNDYMTDISYSEGSVTECEDDIRRFSMIYKALPEGVSTGPDAQYGPMATHMDFMMDALADNISTGRTIQGLRSFMTELEDRLKVNPEQPDLVYARRVINDIDMILGLDIAERREDYDGKR